VDGDLLVGQQFQSGLDLPLQRMAGIAVVLGGPAGRDAGGEHGGVLARAVHVHPVRRAARTEEAPQSALVERQRRRALQRVFGEPGAGQDLADAGDVEVLTGMARGRERQQLTLQVEPAAAHRRGLHRLVG